MEKETSCIHTKAILEYVRAHNQGDVSFLLRDLHPEIDVLEDPEGFLLDPNNWVSCALISELYKRARTALNDDMAPMKMAKYAIENASLGYIQEIFVKAFWSYKMALKHAQKINDKFNLSKTVELVRIKGNEGVVRLHWLKSKGMTKDLCLYNQGHYMNMPQIWGGRPLSLVEHCCAFEGGPYCEYQLRWPAKNRFHEIFSRFFGSKRVLMQTIEEMEEGKKLIERKYEEVNNLNLQLNHKIRQLIALQETGKAILSVLDLDQLLAVIMSLLANVCHIHRAVIMLVNEEESRLEYVYGAGFSGGVPTEVREYRVPLGRVSNILARVADTGRPEYIPDVGISGLRKENILLFHGKPSSVFVVPLITRSKVIGVIATGADNEHGVSRETRETLEVFSPQIAIAIENARLYRRLHEQMEELRTSRALLSRAEKLTFLGNMAARLAHEIKNPMTAIRTFIDMLPRKFDDEEFRTKFHAIALEETKRVNNLITELLDLVKTREPHFEYEDIHALIDKMLLLLSPRSNAKKIRILRDFDPDVKRIMIDAEKMKQVILNLLSNAVEFSPEQGTIEIKTGRCRKEGKQKAIRIQIKDHGKGIPESNIDKIFDPYFTTKHKSTIHSGTGLGLFVAHRNVQDHGGSLDVKSRENEGATFYVVLPDEAPERAAQSEREENGSRAERNAGPNPS